MPAPIPGRTEAIHSFLTDWSISHDWPPTVREIGRGCGITSTSIVIYHLDKLEAAGLIKREPDISRGIALLVAA